MPRPRTCVDVASLLLDYFELSPDVVFSPELNIQELLLMGCNRQAWRGYMSALQVKEQEKQNKRK